LLEHDTFSDLLWAVFHLAEELAHRDNVKDLKDTDNKRQKMLQKLFQTTYRPDLKKLVDISGESYYFFRGMLLIMRRTTMRRER